MTTATSSPITKNWSIRYEADGQSPAIGLRSTQRPSTASARDLNDELGRWTVAELTGFQAELALAVLSLAEAGGQPWSINSDEPTVALLRMSARMGLLQPDVATAQAAQVIEVLELSRLG